MRATNRFHRYLWLFSATYWLECGYPHYYVSEYSITICWHFLYSICTTTMQDAGIMVGVRWLFLPIRNDLNQRWGKLAQYKRLFPNFINYHTSSKIGVNKFCILLLKPKWVVCITNFRVIISLSIEVLITTHLNTNSGLIWKKNINQSMNQSIWKSLRY